MRFRSILCIAIAASATLAFAGCSSNLNRFDVINSGGGLSSGQLQITRGEVADQGSGRLAIVLGSGGHMLERNTVGGTYQRMSSTAATSGRAGHSMTSGLYADPHASQ